jgi:hypothetical protein
MIAPLSERGTKFSSYLVQLYNSMEIDNTRFYFGKPRSSIYKAVLRRPDVYVSETHFLDRGYFIQLYFTSIDSGSDFDRKFTNPCSAPEHRIESSNGLVL